MKKILLVLTMSLFLLGGGVRAEENDRFIDKLSVGVYPGLRFDHEVSVYGGIICEEGMKYNEFKEKFKKSLLTLT